MEDKTSSPNINEYLDSQMKAFLEKHGRPMNHRELYELYSSVEAFLKGVIDGMEMIRKKMGDNWKAPSVLSDQSGGRGA